MKPSRSLIVFSLLFTGLTLSPSYLFRPAPPAGLLRVGDLLDLFTPLLLLPLYALLLWQRRGEWPAWPRMLVFVVLCALWVEGHSLHLAANALGHLLDGSSHTPAWRLSYFLDEHLSHVLWHVSVISLSILLSSGPARSSRVSLVLPLLTALPYGFSFFAITVEGQTAPLGIVSALGISIWIGSSWKRKRDDLFSVFFCASYLVALVLYLTWFLLQGGLPQFSEVGLIH